MAKLKLKKPERKELEKILKTGKVSARVNSRVHILLLLDEGKKETDISDFLKVGRSTIWRTEKKYLKDGLVSALSEKERPGQPPKYLDTHKAEVIALACSSAPSGRKRWSVRLLMAELRPKKGFESINRESIRLILKKAKPNPG